MCRSVPHPCDTYDALARLAHVFLHPPFREHPSFPCRMWHTNDGCSTDGVTTRYSRSTYNNVTGTGSSWSTSLISMRPSPVRVTISFITASRSSASIS